MNRSQAGSNLVRLAALFISMLAPGPLLEASPDPVAELRAEVETLRIDYETRLADLERRITMLEAQRRLDPAATAATRPSDPDERERLREAARAATANVPQEDAAQGRGRNLNRLNPEISLTGNVLGIAASDDRDAFEVQEFELDIRSDLDPYSRTRWTLSVGPEGEVGIEEGYVVYPSIARGLELTAGKFRQRFGKLNRQHLHALPQTEYPPVLTAFFGDGGLAQTGGSLNWLLPRGWASANELALQVTDGSAEAFGGESFRRLVALARLQSYWDLDAATYFEWGLTHTDGETETGGTSRVSGTDLTLHWQPPARALRRELTWRTEVLFSQRDDDLGQRREAWGGYSYLEGMLRRNLSAGLRLDRVEDPADPSRRFRGVVPYLSWWQSEFLRLRGEYQWLEDDLTDESENRFLIQLTWAAGPHKHDSY
jgi:hypothetical protein